MATTLLALSALRAKSSSLSATTRVWDARIVSERVKTHGRQRFRGLRLDVLVYGNVNHSGSSSHENLLLRMIEMRGISGARFSQGNTL